MTAKHEMRPTHAELMDHVASLFDGGREDIRLTGYSSMILTSDSEISEFLDRNVDTCSVFGTLASKLRKECQTGTEGVFTIRGVLHTLGYVENALHAASVLAVDPTGRGISMTEFADRIRLLGRVDVTAYAA